MQEYKDSWPDPENDVCQLEYFKYASHMMIYVVSSILALCNLVLLIKLCRQSKAESNHAKQRNKYLIIGLCLFSQVSLLLETYFNGLWLNYQNLFAALALQDPPGKVFVYLNSFFFFFENYSNNLVKILFSIEYIAVAAKITQKKDRIVTKLDSKTAKRIIYFKWAYILMFFFCSSTYVFCFTEDVL